jgi:hypothetical protein
VPQFMQNFAVAGLSVPQLAQAVTR